MNATTLKRIGIACGSFIFSLGLSTTFALAFIVVAASIGLGRQPLFGAGVGLFSFMVVWPGSLTFSLIFFDGLFTEGFSKQLFLRSSLWGGLLSLGYGSLIKAGISTIGLAGTFGGKGLGTLIAMMLFALPSFVMAFLGNRVNWPRKAAGSV